MLSTTTKKDMLFSVKTVYMQGLLTAKFCVNIAFFGCHTHFSHIATTLYAKWQHRLNKPYPSLVDAVSLNTRSTCKLSLISAIQVSQWRAESEQQNKRITPCKLLLVFDYKVMVKLFLKSYACALSVNKIRIF